MPNPQLTFKFLLLGDGGVGKTSLVHRYIDNSFGNDYKITIGVSISSKIVTLDDGRQCNLSIHDVAGQERFGMVRATFYKGCHLAFAVFDITRRRSLTNLQKNWLPEVYNANPISAVNLPVHVILIGNKIDLEDMRMVEKEEAKEVAKQMRCVDYIETSAKDNINVNEAFKRVSQAYLDSLIRIKQI